MSESEFFGSSDFEEDRATTDPVLLIDTEGFSGPLDLLLELARRQKVDLSKISILKLVEQYLAFIERARTLRLELAADYLVMADRKSTRLNSSHIPLSRMPSSA